MAHVVIIPPKESPPAKKAAPAGEAPPEELANQLTDDGSPVVEAGVKRIPVPKGTSVTIGGRQYVAQSDEGVTIRGFTHAQNGQPTSVVIINAPTKEAAAFAQHLVAAGQMLSEEEVLWRRARGYAIDPALTYDRKTGKPIGNNPRKRRDHMTEDQIIEDWEAHLANLAGSDPRVVTREVVKPRALEEKTGTVTGTGRREETEETVELTTRGKIK